VTSLAKLTLVSAFLLATHANAESSILTVTNVAPNIFAIVGPLGQRTPENLGNNATFGLIVTPEGAILMDPGGSYKGAMMLAATIREITDQPVRYVIDTGGQDHRWLGNGYWQQHGATVIASEDAEADHVDRGTEQLAALATMLGHDGVEGTEPSLADITFKTDYTLSLGGVELEIHHVGAAHTPGDSFVWLADQSVMFTGDIVYIKRILGVGPQSNSKEWLETFRTMAAYNPQHIVPGHGPATDLATATRDTYDYLSNLRTRMAEYIDGGGEIIGSVDVDQSAFSYLVNFDQLARKNAQQVFTDMEWE